MKTIAVLSRNDILYPQTYNKNNHDFNRSIINNNGNLVFIYAINKLIKNPKLHYNITSIDQINECSCLIIPAANWISSSLDMSHIVAYLQKIKIPVIFLGLGVQAKNYEDRYFVLNQSSIDLIKMIKDRGYIVGSRGLFTQEILAQHGVSSIIIGCCSNLLNSDPELVDKLKDKWQENSVFCVGLGNNIHTECPINLKAEQMIFEWGTKYGFYLQQSYLSMINTMRYNNKYSGSYATEEIYNKIGLFTTYEDFQELIIKNSRMYISIDQWMEDLARMDLCFGTRIHGNILATQSQCPSIVVYHDSRTRELAETMEYPRIAIEDFITVRSIEELKEKSTCNYDLYQQAKTALKTNLIKILHEYGVSC